MNAAKLEKYREAFEYYMINRRLNLQGSIIDRRIQVGRLLLVEGWPTNKFNELDTAEIVNKVFGMTDDEVDTFLAMRDLAILTGADRP